MSQSTKTALAAVALIALAGVFWLLLIAPKREQASELSEQITTLNSEVSTEQQRALSGEVAKREFPADYHQMVLLGKAVPADAETPSLLVQLNGLGRRAQTTFASIENGGGGGSESSSAPEGLGVPGAGSLQPLGAAAGPAGLLAMPYKLNFEGGFFQIADFIHGLDSLVTTDDGRVDAKGRLVTIDGFSMAPEEKEKEDGSNGALNTSFSVTTYVTPPGQGLTAGASPSGPAPETSP